MSKEINDKEHIIREYKKLYRSSLGYVEVDNFQIISIEGPTNRVTTKNIEFQEFLEEDKLRRKPLADKILGTKREKDMTVVLRKEMHKLLRISSYLEDFVVLLYAKLMCRSKNNGKFILDRAYLQVHKIDHHILILSDKKKVLAISVGNDLENIEPIKNFALAYTQRYLKKRSLYLFTIMKWPKGKSYILYDSNLNFRFECLLVEPKIRINNQVDEMWNSDTLPDYEDVFRDEQLQTNEPFLPKNHEVEKRKLDQSLTNTDGEIVWDENKCFEYARDFFIAIPGFDHLMDYAPLDAKSFNVFQHMFQIIKNSLEVADRQIILDSDEQVMFFLYIYLQDFFESVEISTTQKVALNINVKFRGQSNFQNEGAMIVLKPRIISRKSRQALNEYAQSRSDHYLVIIRDSDDIIEEIYMC